MGLWRTIECRLTLARDIREFPKLGSYASTAQVATARALIPRIACARNVKARDFLFQVLTKGAGTDLEQELCQSLGGMGTIVAGLFPRHLAPPDSGVSPERCWAALACCKLIRYQPTLIPASEAVDWLLPWIRLGAYPQTHYRIVPVTFGEAAIRALQALTWKPLDPQDRLWEALLMNNGDLPLDLREKAFDMLRSTEVHASIRVRTLHFVSVKQLTQLIRSHSLLETESLLAAIFGKFLGSPYEEGVLQAVNKQSCSSWEVAAQYCKFVDEYVERNLHVLTDQELLFVERGDIWFSFREEVYDFPLNYRGEMDAECRVKIGDTVEIRKPAKAVQMVRQRIENL